MSLRSPGIVFLLFLSLVHTAQAEIVIDSKVEIDHLLTFIKNSHCVFNRNGKDYSAEKALLHIKKKYHYFSDNIKTAEDFIRLAASKSTMSGDYYMVTCINTKKKKTQNWLLQELKRYRVLKLN